MTLLWRPVTFILLASGLVPRTTLAQSDHPDPWAAPVRGSWVRAGPAGPGDVVLASSTGGAELVVGTAENLNVRQAATFLAGDIEAISGYRPPIVPAPTAGKITIRLVTLGNGPLPGAIDAAALRGQWEAYRVVTAPGSVWLVGSNPRGVTLQPGETRTVTFDVGPEQLAYHGPDMKRVVEPGRFDIMVGGNSVDVSSVALDVVQEP